MEPRLGIYIHIPFCASKCGYCDFYSCAGAADRMADYQHALLEHIEESAGRIAPAYIDTVYFGGGTPSFYGAARLIELLDAVKATGRLLKRAEVTVEVNPDSVRLHDLRALHKAGFNRLSIGMQSANNDILKMIGRRHSFHQVEMTVKNARTAGFDNVSLDLIYGLPSQTRSDWADTLAKAIALRPEHISGYGLKLEEGTPMYELKDSPLIPSDDEQADMYLCMVDELRRYGYEQYEISNFSIPGYESRHNLKYWQLDGLKLAAQTGDVDRERVFVHEAVRLPELFHERLAADDAALALEERLQDAVVVFRQLDALPLIHQARIRRVEHGAAMLERGRGRSKIIRAAQDCLDLRQQHVQIKGLGDEIIPAHVHGHDDVHIVRR